MGEFVTAVTSFPAVVFTVGLLVSLGYWALASILGLNDDADADIESDVGADGGGFASIATGLDLHLLPLSLVVTIVSLVGWVVATIASLAIDLDGAAGTAAGVVILIVALAAGTLAAGRAGRFLGPIFAPSPARRHADLLGRVCVVRTGRVDGGFGQAEVTDADGSAHLIQVRCHEPNPLAAGHEALLVDLDDGIFVVSADLDGIR